MISAIEALQRLREGNQRFVSETRNGGERASETRRLELATRFACPLAAVAGFGDEALVAFAQPLQGFYC